MKISIKTFRLFSMAALALVMAACSSNDDMIQQQTAQPQGKKMHFTATIEAPNSDATTRTTGTLDKDANNKDIIKMAWKVGDEIALVHSGKREMATVTAVDGTTGAATIEGPVNSTDWSGFPADGEAVTLVYPYHMVDELTPEEPWDYTPARDHFRFYGGTFDEIFSNGNLDWREGKSTFSVVGDNVTLSSRVKMASNIAVWKLTLQDDAATPNALIAKEVLIKIETSPTTATIVANVSNYSGLSEYYLCMVPVTIPAGDLVIEATVGSDTYTYTKAGGVSLETGKYYQSTVTLTKPAPALIVSPAVGQVIGDDGKNYADATAASLAGATAVAKICYVGSDNGEAAPYNHGLALALSDANGGSSCKWKTSQADAGHTYKPNSSSFTSESGLQYNAMHNSEIDNYPAFKAAIANNGTAAPTGCSAWFLASGYQWKKMAGAAGLTNLGLTEDAAYWSSSERDASQAWVFLNGNWYNINKNTAFRVRSCLAF